MVRRTFGFVFCTADRYRLRAVSPDPCGTTIHPGLTVLAQTGSRPFSLANPINIVGQRPARRPPRTPLGERFTNTRAHTRADKIQNAKIRSPVSFYFRTLSFCRLSSGPNPFRGNRHCVRRHVCSAQKPDSYTTHTHTHTHRNTRTYTVRMFFEHADRPDEINVDAGTTFTTRNIWR